MLIVGLIVQKLIARAEGGGLIVDLIVDLIVQKLISVEGERPNSDLIVQKLIARGGGGYKS